MARSRKGQKPGGSGSSNGSYGSGSSAPSDLYRASVGGGGMGVGMVGGFATEGNYNAWNSSDDYRYMPTETHNSPPLSTRSTWALEDPPVPEFNNEMRKERSNESIGGYGYGKPTGSYHRGSAGNNEPQYARRPIDPYSTISHEDGQSSRPPPTSYHSYRSEVGGRRSPEGISMPILYRAFTITKQASQRRHEGGPICEIQVAIMRLTHDECLERVENLSYSNWETVDEIRARLELDQQDQISEFLRRLQVRETDQNYEWSLAQLETRGPDAPMLVYVKRQPRMREPPSPAPTFEQSILPNRSAETLDTRPRDYPSRPAENLDYHQRDYPAQPTETQEYRSRDYPTPPIEYSTPAQTEPEEPAREPEPPEEPPEPEPELEPELPEKHTCGQCEEEFDTCFYCNVCDTAYCAKCWDRVGPHKSGKLGPGGVPHEKTDEKVASRLRATLEAAPTDIEQDELFGNDQDTTWFGVVKDEAGDSIFCDYGRYADIINEISKQLGPRPGHRFPGLVSFVGETGAGKSTLIKVLIELNETGKRKHQTPVVGSIRHQDVPTSGDVHLYVDPKTFLSEGPILYADCEGLAGGEREPKGARSTMMKRLNGGNKGHQRTNSAFDKLCQNMPHSTEREILWADTPEKQTREFAVTQLYPRLLYTFSDVVVFVLKNPRVIEAVIEKLIDWADAALEMSSNQPVLPHAILVLNASELSIDAEQWNPVNATEWLMNAVKDSIHQNVKCKKHAQTWRSRGKRIETVEDLLLSYYASVRVVRIPGIGRPNLMQTQLEQLYQEIAAASEHSKMRKRELRMLLDAKELQPYLQFAFDHFSKNLDRAFDFVQASFVYNPIPSDFAGNMLKLAVNIMEACGNKLDGEGIFYELSFMVASCIMLDSTRSKTRGLAEMIFPEYVVHCDNALEDFCDRYWPCEFVLLMGHRRNDVSVGKCVNVRSGHGSKGHQNKDGKVIAVGTYQSRFTAESYQETFRYLVFEALEKLLKKLRVRIMQDPSMAEDKIAAQLHREAVMLPFYKHIDDVRNKSLVSHSTCFSCLMSPPQHALPCGHILCTPCLGAYGTQERDAIEISTCPMHVDTTFRSWKIFLKPEAAGVRILTLDGGGIRAIVALEILRLIEQTWGNQMRIQDFFDLIVGTSTGGLVALGLVSMNWSVEQCINEFQQICSKSFARRFGSNIPGYSMIMESVHRSKYEIPPLEEALQQAYSRDDYLFGGFRRSNSRIKVAVTATTSSSISLITNYNRSRIDKLPYNFQRPENAASELKIWEAARAACATPKIFKAFSHEATGQVYSDASLHHANPIQIADLERKTLWPTNDKNLPDFLLSIGTAYNRKSRKTLIEKSSIISGLFGQSKNSASASAAMDQIRSSLAAEKSWKDFMEELGLPESEKFRYQRINPEILEDLPGIDEALRIKDLQHTIRKHMAGDVAIVRAALRLLATAFYFEKTMPVSRQQDGTFMFTGMIRCRLPKSAMPTFGKVLNDFVGPGSPGLYFIVRDRSTPHKSQRMLMSSDAISDLMYKSQWRMGLVEIRMPNLVAVTEFVLVLKNGEEFPISGFPRRLQEDESLIPKRHDSSDDGNRWRDRSVNKQAERKKWIQSTNAPPPGLRRMKSLSGYGSADYTVGQSLPVGIPELGNSEPQAYYSPPVRSPVELPAPHIPSQVGMPQDAPAFELPGAGQDGSSNSFMPGYSFSPPTSPTFNLALSATALNDPNATYLPGGGSNTRIPSIASRTESPPPPPPQTPYVYQPYGIGPPVSSGPTITISEPEPLPLYSPGFRIEDQARPRGKGEDDGPTGPDGRPLSAHVQPSMMSIDELYDVPYFGRLRPINDDDANR